MAVKISLTGVQSVFRLHDSRWALVPRVLKALQGPKCQLIGASSAGSQSARRAAVLNIVTVRYIPDVFVFLFLYFPALSFLHRSLISYLRSTETYIDIKLHCQCDYQINHVFTSSVCLHLIFMTDIPSSIE